jgi:RimJ/RimL family protein N-acetyltransferase
MSIRTKDFTESSLTEPVEISSGPVKVRALSWKSSMEFSDIRARNDESVSEYHVLDNSSLPKIAFGVLYEDTPVGEVSIWSIDKKNKVCRISYWIDSGFRRKGIGSMAVAMVCDYCFDTLEMNEIEIPILEDNIPSRDMARSLFFTIAGYEVLTNKNGTPQLHEIYLQQKANDDEDMKLIDYVLERYVAKEQEQDVDQ